MICINNTVVLTALFLTLSSCGAGATGMSSANEDEVSGDAKTPTTAQRVHKGIPPLRIEFDQDVIESALTQSPIAAVDEAARADKIMREINQMSAQVEQMPSNSAQEAELVRRLALAHRAMAALIIDKTAPLDDDRFHVLQTGNKAAATAIREQIKTLFAKADKHREKSIKLHQRIRKYLPDYSERAEVVFMIAFDHDQMARGTIYKEQKISHLERAKAHYEELICYFPKSRYVPMAWMGLGEIRFYEDRDFERAIHAFEKVVEYGEEQNPVYASAIYYLAWSLFNLERHSEAQDQFKRVITYAEANPGNEAAQVVADHAHKDIKMTSKAIEELKELRVDPRKGERKSVDELRRSIRLIIDDSSLFTTKSNPGNPHHVKEQKHDTTDTTKR